MGQNVKELDPELLFEEVISFPVKYHSTRDEAYDVQSNLQHYKHDKTQKMRERESEGLAAVNTGVKTRQKVAHNIKLYGRLANQEYAHHLKIKQ